MSTVPVKIQNPFARDYVIIDMPRDMRLADMQAVSDYSVKLAAELSGSKCVPESYSMFPVNNIGRMALQLIAKTMPDRLANAQEGEFLMAMIAANRFMRQLLDRVGLNIMMEKKLYVQSIIDFCKKSTPYFGDCVRLRLPMLVRQAHDSVPQDMERAKRLAKLAEIAIKTLDELPRLMGDDYAAWKNGGVVAEEEVAAAPAEEAPAKAEEAAQYGKGEDDESEEEEEEEEEEPPSSPDADDKTPPPEKDKSKDAEEQEPEDSDDDDLEEADMDSLIEYDDDEEEEEEEETKGK